MSYISGMILDTIDATPLFEVGQIGQTDDGKVYKYVKYLDATAGAAGQVTYYTTVAIGGAGSDTVTIDLSDSDEVGAGVLQSALTTGTFGWVQVKGLATLAGALTAGTDGDALTPTGAGDGNLDVNIATAANTDICARAVDASAFIIMCDFVH